MSAPSFSTKSLPEYLHLTGFHSPPAEKSEFTEGRPVFSRAMGQDKRTEREKEDLSSGS